MNQFSFYHLKVFSLAVCLVGATQILSAQQTTATFDDALAQVNAQAPQQYDPVVTPIPDDGAIADLPTLELLRMLDSWNPVLRKKAGSALGERGDEALPVLLKASEAKSGPVRAGAASALAAIIQERLNNWKKAYPEINDSREAQRKILEDNSALEEAFIRLTHDPELEVRVSALQGLETMAPQTSEAAQAVLDLYSDEDVHLAQTAMMVLDKRFSVKGLPEEKVVAALKNAMSSPMPRGRGHVVKTILKLDERLQRKFIPELLAHLDWEPRRDTMFGAGGQADSIELLTEFRVGELVPKLPGLMFKPMRGPGLFMPSLDSAKAFGRDAKVILPELRAILSEHQAEGFRRVRDHDERVVKLRETIAYLEKQ
jgi:HEAT repeat protein